MALLDEPRDTAVFTPGGSNPEATGNYVPVKDSVPPIQLYLVRAGITDILGLHRVEAAIHKATVQNGGKEASLDDVLRTMFGDKRDVRRRLMDHLLREPASQLNFDGKYVLLGQLDEKGGGGIVQFAMDCRESVPRIVVIKSTPAPEANMEPWQIARFKRESKILERLNGERTPKLFDHGSTPGTPAERYPYFAMELVEGHPLNKIMDASGKPLPETLAVALIRDSAAALGAVHKKIGGPHRDIKPQNLILSDAGAVKVIDFGLAALAELQMEDPTTQEQIERLTKTGAVFGTPHYMSPEQSKDAGRVDARTDIYALGVILYQMLTGKNPYAGETVAVTWERHRAFEPDFLQFKNRKLAAVLRKMLQKDPRKRYGSMEEVEAALSETQGGTAALSLAPSSVPANEAPISSVYPKPQDMYGALFHEGTRNDVGIAKPHLARVFAHRTFTRRNALRAILLSGGATALGLPWLLRDSGTEEKEKPLEERLRQEGKYLLGVDIDEKNGFRSIEFPTGFRIEGDQMLQLYGRSKGSTSMPMQFAGGYFELDREAQLYLLGILKPGEKPTPTAYAKLPPEMNILRMLVPSVQVPGKGRMTRIDIDNIGVFCPHETVEHEGRQRTIAQFYSATVGGYGPIRTVVDGVYAPVKTADQSLLEPELQEAMRVFAEFELQGKQGANYKRQRFDPAAVPAMMLKNEANLLKRAKTLLEGNS